MNNIYHVHGPGGFTEKYDADDIRILEQMGLIEYEFQITGTDLNGEFKTIFYNKAGWESDYEHHISPR